MYKTNIKILLKINNNFNIINIDDNYIFNKHVIHALKVTEFNLLLSNNLCFE